MERVKVFLINHWPVEEIECEWRSVSAFKCDVAVFHQGLVFFTESLNYGNYGLNNVYFDDVAGCAFCYVLLCYGF